MAEVRGYVVLRRPESNTGESSIVAPHTPPRIHGRYYCGFDRMPWSEVEVSYYEGSLPKNLVTMRREIWEHSPAELDFKLCADLVKAKALLDFSNRVRSLCELVAVDSDLLARHPRVSAADINVEWLGADLYCHGYGSLLLQGLFTHPEVFADFESELNEHGLFDHNRRVIERYRAAYIARTTNAGLEPIGDLATLDVAAVGRVIV
jgi:hypothetical protein